MIIIFVVQQVSYVYEKFPIDAILMQSSEVEPHFEKGVSTQCHNAMFFSQLSIKGNAYMNTYCQRFRDEMYSIKVEISVFRGGKDIKPQEIQNTSIKLCHQKVAYQGRMCCSRQYLLKKVFVQYLCAKIKRLSAQTSITRLQLEFQQSLLHYKFSKLNFTKVCQLDSRSRGYSIAAHFHYLLRIFFRNSIKIHLLGMEQNGIV